VDDCAQRLPDTVRVGVSQQEAEGSLDQCGFSHSFDEKSNTIFALKRGEQGIVMRTDWTAEVKLDEQRKVISIKVEKVGTGP
jgi:hypothetical protein